MHRKMAADREREYEHSLPIVKKRLISCLVHYGTYLKNQKHKNDRDAENSLKKVIRYDRENPMAHYRLGFLHYKWERYSSALGYFQSATRFQKDYSNGEYKLNDQQLYNAYLYLYNSALYIAQEAQEDVQKYASQEIQAGSPQLQMSSLYETIQRNEDYLKENAFTIVTRDGEKRCSEKRV